MITPSNCVCVLTGLRDGQYGRIMRWWSYKPQSGISTALESVDYCYVLLSCIPWYSSTQIIYYTRSFSHLGFTHLRPRISTYRTRSSAHLGFSCLCPSIPDYPYASTHSPGSYCMALSPHRLLIFSSRKIYAKVSLSWFSSASWKHYAYLLRPPPLYPFSYTHTSKIDRNYTHYAMVAFHLPI